MGIWSTRFGEIYPLPESNRRHPRGAFSFHRFPLLPVRPELHYTRRAEIAYFAAIGVILVGATIERLRGETRTIRRRQD